jgi:CheY-like chemotaxis protein
MPRGGVCFRIVRILLVEDEPLIASFVGRGLRAEGYATSVAIGGDEAVVELRERDWDLVILDLMLPGLDGFAVLAKALEFDPHLPVLVLSAQTGVAMKVAALDAGAIDYLAKPFSFDELRGFDPGFRMYGEDIDLCYRLKLGGWKVFYVPAATAVHVKGASTRQATTRMLYEFHRAMWTFHHKHYAEDMPAFANGLVWASIWARWATLAARASITKDRRISP